MKINQSLIVLLSIFLTSVSVSAEAYTVDLINATVSGTRTEQLNKSDTTQDSLSTRTETTEAFPGVKTFTSDAEPSGFSCGTLSCSCSGENDCANMFATDACGESALCEVDADGNTVGCVCLRD